MCACGHGPVGGEEGCVSASSLSSTIYLAGICRNFNPIPICHSTTAISRSKYNSQHSLNCAQTANAGRTEESREKLLFTLAFISEKIKFKWPNYGKTKAYKLTFVQLKRSHSFFSLSLSLSIATTTQTTLCERNNVKNMPTTPHSQWFWWLASWICEQQIESQLNGLPFSQFDRSSEWRWHRACDARERTHDRMEKRREREEKKCRKRTKCEEWKIVVSRFREGKNVFCYGGSGCVCVCEPEPIHYPLCSVQRTQHWNSLPLEESFNFLFVSNLHLHWYCQPYSICKPSAKLINFGIRFPQQISHSLSLSNIYNAFVVVVAGCWHCRIEWRTEGHLREINF